MLKKWLTKSISVLLCAVMLLSVAPLSGFVGLELPDWANLFSAKASATDYESISVGETKTINVSEGETVMLMFTPTASGTYSFYSTAYEDTFGHLYDGDMNELTKDDDSGENNNFKITCNLEKGNTYYFGARYYSNDNFGSFDVTLVCDALACEHLNTTSHEAVASTCTEVGYTEGVYCEDCQEWISGHEEKPIHTDEDEDGYCDICGEIALPIVASGQCGDNATYTIYDALGDNILVVSGTGAMYDYGMYKAPWYSYGIVWVIIKDDITSIGKNAFFSCRWIDKVFIYSKVTEIGAGAFEICDSLDEILIPNNTKDAKAILRASAKLESLTDEQFVRADVNKDGKVNTKDAKEILKFTAKLPSVLS